MNRHLVAVKVGVKCRADEWVQLNCLAFNQHWLKRLNTQTVQCWCTVEHDWVLANDFFENIPNNWRLTFNFLLRRLNGGGDS